MSAIEWWKWQAFTSCTFLSSLCLLAVRIGPCVIKCLQQFVYIRRLVGSVIALIWSDVTSELLLSESVKEGRSRERKGFSDGL